MKKLLVVIDYQNDFVSGSLGFEQAKEKMCIRDSSIPPRLHGAWLKYWLITFIPVILSSFNADINVKIDAINK